MFYCLLCCLWPGPSRNDRALKSPTAKSPYAAENNPSKTYPLKKKTKNRKLSCNAAQQQQQRAAAIFHVLPSCSVVPSTFLSLSLSVRPSLRHGNYPWVAHLFCVFTAFYVCLCVKIKSAECSESVINDYNNGSVLVFLSMKVFENHAHTQTQA